MYDPCRVCGAKRSYGDNHQQTHSHYERAYRNSSNRTPRDDKDILILEYIGKLSYVEMGKLFGCSKQAIGQRVARMGIYQDKNKIPKKYRKAA